MNNVALIIIGIRVINIRCSDAVMWPSVQVPKAGNDWLRRTMNSGGSSPGPGGACPPLAAWHFFRQYINIIAKPTAYDGPWEY